MKCTVAELLDRLSSEELTEWMAFANIEPFGSESKLIGHAITSKTIADINRKQGAPPYKLEVFMPKYDKEPQSVDQMLLVAQMLTEAFGGENLRGE